MAYQRRIVDDLLDEVGSELSTIVVRGARAVGKSATAARRAKTTYALDDPNTLALAQADPDLLVRGERPILIDEWQKWPPSWDRVRREVDVDPSSRFLLAGSAEPQEQPSHSGAGRFVFLHLRPMSLVERGLEAPHVSLAGLLSGDRDEVGGGSTDVGLADYASEIVRSGFPGIRTLSERARRLRLGGYLEATFGYAISNGSDEPRYDPGALRRWAQSYAAATATTSSYETIRDGATPGESEKPSYERTAAIRRALERAYVIDPVPAWLPSLNQLSQLGKAPKHNFVDPALAAELRGLDAEALVQPGGLVQGTGRHRPYIAALFESLVAQSVRVYAEHNEATVYHLRTHRGEREVDLIVERRDGSVVALEVKLASTPGPDDFKHLTWLKRRIGDRLLDAGVVTTGSHTYRDPATSFAVIPAALLGP